MTDITDDAIEIRVPCKPEYVRTIRRTISEYARSINMPRAAVEEVEIAASEAVANIVRHAYPDDHHKIPPVRVRCFHTDDLLTIEVIDKGRGFAPPAPGTIPDIDMNRDGGMGIILIQLLMDNVNYCSKPTGTRLRMTKSARQAVHTATRKRVARLRGSL